MASQEAFIDLLNASAFSNVNRISPRMKRRPCPSSLLHHLGAREQMALAQSARTSRAPLRSLIWKSITECKDNVYRTRIEGCNNAWSPSSSSPRMSSDAADASSCRTIALTSKASVLEWIALNSRTPETNSARALVFSARRVSSRSSRSWRSNIACCEAIAAAASSRCAARAVAAKSPWCLFVAFTTNTATSAANTADKAAPTAPLQSSNQCSCDIPQNMMFSLLERSTR